MKDLIIIGGSAAGTAAAIYSARRKLNFDIISEDFGGEVARSGEVWNYPGFPETNGIDLADTFFEHLKANAVTPEIGVRVESITKNGEGDFTIAGKKGKENVTYHTKAVIVATGAHPRHLDVPGEEEYYGKGVTYCTTCDGPLYKGKKVVTIGGGSAGLESALMLAEIASHITLINIRDTFKGEQVLVDKVLANDKIDVVYNAKTKRIEGEMVVNTLVYEDTVTGEEKTVDTQGVFVHIGMIPNTSMVPQEVARNAYGEIEIDQKCSTNITGLFAAGDVTSIPYKQITIATGLGATAALSAIEYINKLA